jgi:hypothetical protein
MLLLKLTAASLIVIATVFGLFYVLRQLREDAGGGGRKRTSEKPMAREELESFIAAYRRDKSVASQVAPEAASQPPAPAAAPATNIIQRRTLLSPSAKLAYLSVKAALPDHHVFANIRVMDALELAAGHPLAALRIDIVICDKDFHPLAGIDIGPGTQGSAPAEIDKAQRLQAAGVRHLRFAPDAIPKPAELRTLISAPAA